MSVVRFYFGEHCGFLQCRDGDFMKLKREVKIHGNLLKSFGLFGYSFSF
jgi:hypothetical protein